MEPRSRLFFTGMLPFFVLAHFAHHLLTALPIPLLPFIRKEFSFVRMPVSEAFIISQTSIHHRSTVYGIYYFTMMEAGAIFAPIMGYLLDHFGFHSSFTIASVTAITLTFSAHSSYGAARIDLLHGLMDDRTTYQFIKGE